MATTSTLQLNRPADAQAPRCRDRYMPAGAAIGSIHTGSASTSAATRKVAVPVGPGKQRRAGLKISAVAASTTARGDGHARRNCHVMIERDQLSGYAGHRMDVDTARVGTGHCRNRSFGPIAVAAVSPDRLDVRRDDDLALRRDANIARVALGSVPGSMDAGHTGCQLGADAAVDCQRAGGKQIDGAANPVVSLALTVERIRLVGR